MKFDDQWVTSIPIQNWHFLSRLYQRYNITLLPGEYTMILQQIENGKAQALSSLYVRKDKTSRGYRVQWDRSGFPEGQTVKIIVVYDYKYKRLITALNPELFLRNPNKRYRRPKKGM